MGNAYKAYKDSFNFTCDSISGYSFYDVENSIDNGCPVHIRGQNSSGHAWVIDGIKYNTWKYFYYDYWTAQLSYYEDTGVITDRYIRNNWGWGQASSWTLSDIYSFDSKYPDLNRMICNIKPKRDLILKPVFPIQPL